MPIKYDNNKFSFVQTWEVATSSGICILLYLYSLRKLFIWNSRNSFRFYWIIIKLFGWLWKFLKWMNIYLNWGKWLAVRRWWKYVDCILYTTEIIKRLFKMISKYFRNEFQTAEWLFDNRLESRKCFEFKENISVESGNVRMNRKLNIECRCSRQSWVVRYKIKGSLNYYINSYAIIDK